MHEMRQRVSRAELVWLVWWQTGPVRGGSGLRGWWWIGSGRSVRRSVVRLIVEMIGFDERPNLQRCYNTQHQTGR